MNNERDGVVTKAGDGVYNVRYERRYAVPIERVWAALTEPERLADWLAEARIDLREGGTIELHWPVPNDHMTGKIVAFDPPHLFGFTWPEPDGAPGSIVRFELFEEKGGCRLVLTNTLLRVEYLLSVSTGWHSHLDELPSALWLEGPVGWEKERELAFFARGKELVRRYRTSLPREAMAVEQKDVNP